MAFHDILHRLIEERGLTQKQTALELHIPVSTLGGYVQGTSEPDFATLKLLSAYFGVTADYLLEYPIGTAETPEETELLRVFRSLTHEQQRIFLEQGRVFMRYNAAIGKADKGHIPGKN